MIKREHSDNKTIMIICQSTVYKFFVTSSIQFQITIQLYYLSQTSVKTSIFS